MCCIPRSRRCAPNLGRSAKGKIVSVTVATFEALKDHGTLVVVVSNVGNKQAAFTVTALARARGGVACLVCASAFVV